MPAPPPCSICHQVVSTKNPMLACVGLCGQSFHFTCVNLALELKDQLKTTPGLCWKCVACRKTSHCLDTLLSRKLEEMSNLLLEKFSTLKDSLHNDMKHLSEEIKQNLSATNVPQPASRAAIDGTINAQQLYSSVASASIPRARVIVKPKVKDQPTRITKSTILNKTDPVGLGIKISGVQPTRDGGVILGCQSTEDSERLLSAASKELSDDYDVKIVAEALSRIRIVGITDNYSCETITRYLKAQNEHIFTDQSIYQVTGVFPVKNRSSIYYATLKVDVSLYSKILKMGRVIIGLDSCSVYDAFALTRCYCCNEFNHIAAKCPLKDKPICGRCTQNHPVKECTAPDSQICCSNCLKYNIKSKENFDTKHLVWEFNKCGAYKIMLQRAKKKLFGSSTEE